PLLARAPSPRNTYITAGDVKKPHTHLLVDADSGNNRLHNRSLPIPLLTGNLMISISQLDFAAFDFDLNG
ncbi:hypothetical protein PanWU01x14_164760, partial [Parasponia andersonii]